MAGFKSQGLYLCPLPVPLMFVIKPRSGEMLNQNIRQIFKIHSLNCSLFQYFSLNLVRFISAVCMLLYTIFSLILIHLHRGNFE